MTLDERLDFLTSQRFHWIYIFSISIFFFIFLIVFLPFGVNEPKKEFNLLTIAQFSMFGWIIFFTLLLSELLIRRKFIRTWTFKVFVIWVIWTFISSGTTNFLFYNYLQDWYDLHWSSYMMHLINVSMVEIFPVIGVFFYFRHQDLHLYLEQANTLKDTHDILQTPITFIGESEKDRITLGLYQVLYVEADDNYVVIYFIENGQLKKNMMRSSLSSIESADYPINFLIRIHRSFLVNTFLVESISGNVHKSELKLRHIDTLFPVSRTYITAVRSRIAEM